MPDVDRPRPWAKNPPVHSEAARPSATDLPHLFELHAEELVVELARRGVVATEAEARRVLAHVVSWRRDDLGTMVRPVRKAVREAIDRDFDRTGLEVVERVTDPSDGFVKYLFRSPDGALHEAVRIPLHQPGRFSVCLSSQVGCAMRCDFCATGRLGLSRNLRAWEMVAAHRAVADEADGRVSGVVFMGQGEPLANYDEVMRAASILRSPNGGRVRAQAITISTVGLVPQIRRFTSERQPYRLIVSLTSAMPERRLRLLPVAGRFALEDLAAALREHAKVAPGRVTLAWVLMGGVNDDPEEVSRLSALFDGLPLRVNLIDVNDARPDGYRRSTDAERDAFIDALQVLEVPVVRRYSGGRARNAACGMLAASRFDV